MSKRKVVVAGIIGNVVEYYDFGIYIVFAEIINKLYFLPILSKKSSYLFFFAIFAVGFFFRPLGGVIFGHIGDRFGRKVALTLSIIGMAIFTGLIGLLPTFEQIGMLAPILLVVIRMFQGVCIGGEGAGSAVFILEHCKSKNVGFWGALVMSSNVTGTLLAVIVGIIFEKYCGVSNMTWRYGFFLGVAMGLLGLLLRKNSSESPVFKNIQCIQKVSKLPIKDVLIQKWQSILILVSLAGVASSSTYLVRGYFNTYLSSITNISGCQILYILSISLITLIVALLFFGCLSDKIGVKKYLYIMIIFYVLLIFPVFKLMKSYGMQVFFLCITVIIISLLSACISAPYYAFAIKFFDPEIRYSGISLGWNLGNSIFGGTTPLICGFLNQYLGIGPEYYLIFTAFIFLFISFVNRKFVIDH